MAEVFYHDVDAATLAANAEYEGVPSDGLFAEPLPLEAWPDVPTTVLVPTRRSPLPARVPAPRRPRAPRRRDRGDGGRPPAVPLPPARNWPRAWSSSPAAELRLALGRPHKFRSRAPPRRSRRLLPVAPLAVAALALGLLVAGCGGGGSTNAAVTLPQVAGADAVPARPAPPIDAHRPVRQADRPGEAEGPLGPGRLPLHPLHRPLPDRRGQGPHRLRAPEEGRAAALPRRLRRPRPRHPGQRRHLQQAPPHGRGDRLAARLAAPNWRTVWKAWGVKPEHNAKRPRGNRAQRRNLRDRPAGPDPGALPAELQARKARRRHPGADRAVSARGRGTAPRRRERRGRLARRAAAGSRSRALVVAAIGVAELASGSGSTATGRAAPPLPTKALRPPAVDLAALRGKPALVDFFASWCDALRAKRRRPCASSRPSLGDRATRRRGRLGRRGRRRPRLRPPNTAGTSRCSPTPPARRAKSTAWSGCRPPSCSTRRAASSPPSAARRARRSCARRSSKPPERPAPPRKSLQVPHQSG